METLNGHLDPPPFTPMQNAKLGFFKPFLMHNDLIHSGSCL
jgi:hypothetical protein